MVTFTLRVAQKQIPFSLVFNIKIKIFFIIFLHTNHIPPIIELVTCITQVFPRELVVQDINSMLHVAFMSLVWCVYFMLRRETVNY